MDASQLPGGVMLYYTDKAVHLTTNDALMTFLRQKGNGSRSAARSSRATRQNAARRCRSPSARWRRSC